MEIKEIRNNEKELNQVEKLFLELYDYMEGKGLLLSLSESGEKKWIDSIKKILGKFGVLYGAVVDSNIIGFAYGVFKMTPQYLGSKKIGFINYVYVKPEYRNRKIGISLVEQLTGWFTEKKVDSFELQVLSGNDIGINFWESCGFRRELIQMRTNAVNNRSTRI